MSKKRLKAGVLGARRGSLFIRGFNDDTRVQLSAVCDKNENALKELKNSNLETVLYTDYDKFLQHDLDVIAIAGYCTDHAPQAIKAMKSGRHVISEVTACKTLAEGVELCRTVEETKKTYMMAENCCYYSYILEMEKHYRKGNIGEFIYGECEYFHNCAPYWDQLTDSRYHWRNWIPPMYYSAHPLGPMLTITKTRPVSVTGFVYPNSALSRGIGKYSDDLGMFVCKMDNSALLKVLVCNVAPREPSLHWYMLSGTKGVMENDRWKDEEILNVYSEKKNKPFRKSYKPDFGRGYSKIKKYGHGGSDFFMVKEFIDAVTGKISPAVDVYSAMDMTIPGILAYRSALNNSAPQEVPDFRIELVRKKYENDNWSPDPKDCKLPNQPSPSVKGFIEIPDSVFLKTL